MKREVAILKRLGPVPFWRGETKCLDALEQIYRRAMEAADAALMRPSESVRRRGVGRP